MKNLTDHLVKYAEYHRHPHNILTHLVGIPLIVAALAALLSRPAIDWFGITATPALVVSIAAVVFYVWLDVMLGLIMAVLMAFALWFGAWSAAQPTDVWLAIGLGGFVAGWIIQFVGHYFEGRKPAFVDDLVGLLIGPLFVLAEVLFMLGLRQSLRAEIEARAGGLQRARFGQRAAG